MGGTLRGHQGPVSSCQSRGLPPSTRRVVRHPCQLAQHSLGVCPGGTDRTEPSVQLDSSRPASQGSLGRRASCSQDTVDAHPLPCFPETRLPDVPKPVPLFTVVQRAKSQSVRYRSSGQYKASRLTLLAPGPVSEDVRRSLRPPHPGLRQPAGASTTAALKAPSGLSSRGPAQGSAAPGSRACVCDKSRPFPRRRGSGKPRRWGLAPTRRHGLLQGPGTPSLREARAVRGLLRRRQRSGWCLWGLERPPAPWHRAPRGTKSLLGLTSPEGS